MLCIYDNLTPHPPTLSYIIPPVATTPTRIRLISWNQPKILLPLQQLSYFHTLFVHFCINLVFWLLVSNVAYGVR